MTQDLQSDRRAQLDLFRGRSERESTTPTAARGTDPATSHEAAALMSGGGHGHDERCLAALRHLGTATYREVAQEAGLEPIQAQRALTRLSYRGDVRQRNDTRACRTNGRRMQLWEATQR